MQRRSSQDLGFGAELGLAREKVTVDLEKTGLLLQVSIVLQTKVSSSEDGAFLSFFRHTIAVRLHFNTAPGCSEQTTEPERYLLQFYSAMLLSRPRFVHGSEFFCSRSRSRP